MTETHGDVPTLDPGQLEQIRQLEQFRPGLRSQLLALFESNSQEQLRQLQAAMAKADRESARICAHSLKGVAASMGATRLSKISGSLETACQRAGVAVTDDEVRALATATAHTLASALEELRAWSTLQSR